MIHITSEGNLFTSFCISVAGTARFHHLTVTALFQFFFIYSVILFIFVSLALIFLLAIFVGSICCLYKLCNNCVCNSGIETDQVG